MAKNDSVLRVLVVAEWPAPPSDPAKVVKASEAFAATLAKIEDTGGVVVEKDSAFRSKRASAKPAGDSAAEVGPDK